VVVKLTPNDAAYPRGAKRMLAIRRYHVLRESRGDAHPATRAAYGRLLFHLGHVPQRGSRSIEAVAWLRESGAMLGVLNRRERRSIRRPS
jgi:hypothetical protein